MKDFLNRQLRDMFMGYEHIDDLVVRDDRDQIVVDAHTPEAYVHAAGFMRKNGWIPSNKLDLQGRMMGESFDCNVEVRMSNASLKTWTERYLSGRVAVPVPCLVEAAEKLTQDDGVPFLFKMRQMINVENKWVADRLGFTP